jgi:hypothetical protein
MLRRYSEIPSSWLSRRRNKSCAHPALPRFWRERRIPRPGHFPLLAAQFIGRVVAPIVRSKGRYYAFLPQLIWRNLDKILSAYIEATDAEYWQKFLDNRATWLELESLRLIASQLQGAVTHHSLRYELTEDGINKRMEVDGIILFDGHLILVSAKSGQVTAPARRGAFGRMKKTFSDLVADGFDQLTKVKNHLAAHPRGAEFFCENGTRVVIQPPAAGRLFLPVNVTLDDLGSVAM